MKPWSPTSAPPEEATAFLWQHPTNTPKGGPWWGPRGRPVRCWGLTSVALGRLSKRMLWVLCPGRGAVRGKPWPGEGRTEGGAPQPPLPHPRGAAPSVCSGKASLAPGTAARTPAAEFFGSGKATWERPRKLRSQHMWFSAIVSATSSVDGKSPYERLLRVCHSTWPARPPSMPPTPPLAG